MDEGVERMQLRRVHDGSAEVPDPVPTAPGGGRVQEWAAIGDPVLTVGVVEDQNERVLPIGIGIIADGWVEITSGLSGDELIRLPE